MKGPWPVSSEFPWRLRVTEVSATTGRTSEVPILLQGLLCTWRTFYTLQSAQSTSLQWSHPDFWMFLRNHFSPKWQCSVSPSNKWCPFISSNKILTCFIQTMAANVWQGFHSSRYWLEFLLIGGEIWLWIYLQFLSAVLPWTSVYTAKWTILLAVFWNQLSDHDRVSLCTTVVIGGLKCWEITTPCQWAGTVMIRQVVFRIPWDTWETVTN